MAQRQGQGNPLAQFAGSIERHPARTGAVALGTGAAIIGGRTLRKMVKQNRALADAEHPGGGVMYGPPRPPQYGPPRPPRATGMDVVRNAGTRGPKTPVGVPRAPRPQTPIHPDSPLAAVNRSVGDVQQARSSARRISGQVYNAASSLFDWSTSHPLGETPPRGSVPPRRGVTPSATNRGQSFAAKSSAMYGGMSPGEKGSLRRQTNKAAAAAKPLYQQGLSIRYGEAPTPPKPKTTRKPRGKKAPAATTIEVPAAPTETKPKTTRKPRSAKVPEPVTVEVTPQEPKKPSTRKTTTKAGSAAKGAAKSGNKEAAVAELKRIFAPSEVESTTPAKPKGKGRGTPKNTMKAPTSAKPPSPAGGAKKAPAPASPKPFKSTYIPNPASDAMTRYGGWGRTTHGTLRIETTPAGMRHEMRSRTHRYGPVSKGALKKNPEAVGEPRLSPIENATSTMFPGTPDRPVTGQPHMQGRGAKVIGEQGNFRVWQGNKRSEIVVQHRTGRQVNLPYNPNKQGPVNVHGILEYANRKGKGDNDKAFLKGGWTADGRTVSGKIGVKNRLGRFMIGAAKVGGILSIPAAAATVLAGSDPLEAAGFQVDKAGEGTNWYAKAHPKRFAAEQRATKKYVAAYNARRAGSQFKGAANWSDIARKYIAEKK